MPERARIAAEERRADASGVSVTVGWELGRFAAQTAARAIDRLSDSGGSAGGAALSGWLLVQREPERVRVELRLECDQGDARRAVLVDIPADPAWLGEPLAGTGARLIHADVPGVIRLTVLEELTTQRRELLLATTPILSDRLGVCGGTYDAPTLIPRGDERVG